MLQLIRDYGKYVEITGFKNVKFLDAEGFLKAQRKKGGSDLDVQFFDAELIATYRHLYFAVLNALQSFHNKTNISKTLAVETMIYASAQRQIRKAIDRCGIKPSTTRMAAIIIGRNPNETQILLREIALCVGSERNETVLELSDDKRRKIKQVFEVKTEEIEAVMKDENEDDAIVNLVVERVALLATRL